MYPLINRSNENINILVRGNYQEGNFGDDALLIAVHLLLSRFSSSLFYDCETLAYQKGIVKNVKCYRNIAFSRFDLIVYGGGTQFFSFEEVDKNKEQSSMPIRFLRLAINPLYLGRSISFRFKHRIEKSLPHISIGTGIGPFVEGSPEENNAVAMIKSMDFVWVRDPVSAGYCIKHQVSKFIVSSDLCFTEPFYRYATNEVHLANNNDRKVLGIIIRDWKYGYCQNYYKKTVHVARYFRQKGIDVRFFLFSHLDNKCRNYLRAEGETVLEWDPSNQTISDYCGSLQECDVILTSRYHGAIFSILFGIPFVTIALEPKLSMVADLMETGFAKLLPDAEVSEYCDCIEHYLCDLVFYRGKVDLVKQKQRDLALQGEIELEKFFIDAGIIK